MTEAEATPRPSLARGAAVTTVATAISRVTGFIRVVVVASALGTTFLANTYQTANTAPNIVFELLAAGVLTSIFVPTFVEYLVKDRREEGWEAANALTSVALVALVGIAVAVGLAAPLIMRALTLGVDRPLLRQREIETGATLLRLFSPQIVFYGVGMIVSGALHAHRRFALPAVAPIFNNLIVIEVYLTYAAMRGNRPPTLSGISGAEEMVLGVGTTLGVVAMTVCLIPPLVRLGWRFRFRFDLGHPAVRKGARLGVWALSYAGGYQAGLLVVLLLANKIEGGVAAYQWAYTFFFLPHALFAVPIFNVLFTAMSEHVAQGDPNAMLGRLRGGMSMLTFVLVPIAAALVVVAEPLARVTLQYGVMTGAGAELVARVLACFAVGLPMYSAFLVLTRGFFALGDTKTPALVNVGTIAVASITGALLFNLLPDGWEVAGLALGHSIAFAFGMPVLGKLFARRAGSLGATALTRSIVVSIVAGAVAVAVMLVVRGLVPSETRIQAVGNLIVTASTGAIVYLAASARAATDEMTRLVAIARRLAGR